MKGMLRNVIGLIYFCLPFLLFNPLISCTGAGLSGGGTNTAPGPQNLLTPPGNPTPVTGGAATPGAEENTMIINPDPTGDNLVEVRAKIQGVCLGGGDVKKVLIKAGLYWYKNEGDWLGHPIWGSPQPFREDCVLRVVFPRPDGLHFKDVECGYPPGIEPMITLQGNGPVHNYFEMSLSTTALMESVPSISPTDDMKYLKDPRYIRVALKSPHYQFPQEADDSCNKDSCLQIGVRGVRHAIEYIGFENLPECAQPEIAIPTLRK